MPHIQSISSVDIVSDTAKLDLILSSKCLAMGIRREIMDARRIVTREELIEVIEGVLPFLVEERYSDSWLSEDTDGQTVNVFSDEAQKRCTYGWVLKIAFDRIRKERHASVHLSQRWAESVAIQLDYEIVKLTEGRRCLASGDYLNVERPYEHMRELLQEVAGLL